MTGKDKAVALSKNNIQHIKKHTFEGMKEQVKYLAVFFFLQVYRGTGRNLLYFCSQTLYKSL